MQRIASVIILLFFAVVAHASEDYLTTALRKEVEDLKASSALSATTPDNALQRADVLWRWINAYSLTGAQNLNVDVTLGVGLVLAYPQFVKERLRYLDPIIRELTLIDEFPNAIGKLMTDPGPFMAKDFVTIRQKYTVAEKEVTEGGGFVLARHFMPNIGIFQAGDPTGDNYVSIESSNSSVRFEESVVPVPGMHGGFRRTRETLTFRLVKGVLKKGDTVTVIYGDKRQGSKGLLMADFSSDRMPLPLYLDFDGSGHLFTLPIQPIRVTGREIAGVRGFAPTIVATGESFKISVRSQDKFYNRATGHIPDFDVYVNGKHFSVLKSGNQAITWLSDIKFDEPGVYRFEFVSIDGEIIGEANPVLVEDEPAQRIYWGDTHGHSGFAEGVGTPDRFMQWAIEDARLDYVTHSEHDVWMDDYEWQVLRENIRKYTKPGEFTPFLGYEWTVNNFQGGHHNVLYRTPEGRQRIPMQRYSTLSRLYAGLREHNDPADVVIIPHAHQAGDYRQSDPLMETLVEIMSQHGTFEWFGRMYLNQGHQVGFTAASDNHLSQPGYTAPKGGSLSQVGGLGALMAPGHTRDNLFDAMKSLRTYATSGDRMILKFSVNGHAMGSRGEFAAQRIISGRVVGTSTIDNISVIKNDEVIWTRHYNIEAAGSESKSGKYKLTFYSDSEPIHPGDNPRGWRPWRGSLIISGATVIGGELTDFDNHQTQALKIVDVNKVDFSTHTRGDTSSIILDLDNVTDQARIEIQLLPGREFGGAPPIYRKPKMMPASEVSLALRSDLSGSDAVSSETVIPFGEYRDSISVSRMAALGQDDVSFEFEDESVRQGDYYFMRVTQTNDAVGWSSPIWIGGYPPR